MKPNYWLISADIAIDYLEKQGYVYERVKLPKFESYESGKLNNKEAERVYDLLLLAKIDSTVQFYYYDNSNRSYKKYNLLKKDFIIWLKNWHYDDDIIIQSNNNLITVFHHSGYIFYFGITQN